MHAIMRISHDMDKGKIKGNYDEYTSSTGQ